MPLIKSLKGCYETDDLVGELASSLTIADVASACRNDADFQMLDQLQTMAIDWKLNQQPVPISALHNGLPKGYADNV